MHDQIVSTYLDGEFMRRTCISMLLYANMTDIGLPELSCINMLHRHWIRVRAHGFGVSVAYSPPPRSLLFAEGGS
jgi:hypothetical protein